MMDWISVITALGGLLSGAGGMGFLYWRQNRKIKDAEVKQREADALLNELNVEKARIEVEQSKVDADAKRLDDLHRALDASNASLITANGTIETLMGRISADNKALDDKTARIRQLTDTLYTSEREKDKLNDDRTDLLKRLHNEITLKTHYKHWLCTHPKSREGNPCYRLPPQDPEIEGQEYSEPEISTKLNTDT